MRTRRLCVPNSYCGRFFPALVDCVFASDGADDGRGGFRQQFHEPQNTGDTDRGGVSILSSCEHVSASTVKAPTAHTDNHHLQREGSSHIQHTSPGNCLMSIGVAHL